MAVPSEVEEKTRAKQAKGSLMRLDEEMLDFGPITIGIRDG